MGALALTGQPAKVEPFRPLPGDVTHIDFGDVDALRAAVTSETAMVILEPIQGENGVVVPPPGYLTAAREICTAAGALLVLDEVQTGVGRTGRFWGHQHFVSGPEGDRLADIVILAKGIASGFPLSAIAAGRELMSRARPGSQGGTYGGNAVSCAAALATLEVIREEKLVENAAEQGARLQEGLRRVAATQPAVGDVRGLGLMCASEFTDASGAPDPGAAARVQAEAVGRGLLLLTCGALGNVVRMIPALVVTAEQVDEALGIWEEAVAAGTGG